VLERTAAGERAADLERVPRRTVEQGVAELELQGAERTTGEEVLKVLEVLELLEERTEEQGAAGVEP
jgi:hypothetical protein